MEKSRSTTQSGLNSPRNPGQEQRQVANSVEDSISSWLTDNQQTENYVPPVLSPIELQSIQNSSSQPNKTSSQPTISGNPNLPSRKVSLILSEEDEDCLIALRRGLVRYEEGDWVPSDEEIIKTLIQLLPEFDLKGVRLLCLQDLLDALKFKIQQTEQ